MLRSCKTVKGSGGGKPSLSGKRKPPSTAAKEKAKKARRKARAARTAGAAEIDAAAALLSVAVGGSRGVASGSKCREDVGVPWADRDSGASYEKCH
ncbi:hypothetical protein P3T76_003840 [Phytophthora citrophthora]|uniref:Uncharacterized protein n=1 Tax=Phytophthora citrophthora TaxID=4793 RepID=A0AAD9LS92_9STRA|nr:hypothetical protein P3T76_003840 [Phytophthora citrophthora]